MQAIQHLYQRAGFGMSPDEWRQKRDWSVQRAVDELFVQAKRPSLLPLPAMLGAYEGAMTTNQQNRVEILKDQIRRVAVQGADWIVRMADPEQSPLVERMALFWHEHFACDIKNERLAVQYLNVLRQHGLGNFRSLALEISRTPAMIRYLNNQQNRKDSPNENFARELMELFTLGRGLYAEQDVKEAARAFTGWSSTLQGDFIFRPVWHDYGAKQFLGKSGNFDGGDILDIILERKEAARFIVRKVYRHFVNEQVDEGQVGELTEYFYQSGYDIGKLMRRIFESAWFYAPANMGSKIKSPVELLAGCMRIAAIRFEEHTGPTFVQRALGQVLFHPPNVAGWPGGKNWVDNSTLMLRLNLPSILISGYEAAFRPKDELTAADREPAMRRLNATYDLKPLMWMTAGKANIDEAIRELSGYLGIPQEARAVHLIPDYVQTNGINFYIRQVLERLMSLPEFQMC